MCCEESANRRSDRKSQIHGNVHQSKRMRTLISGGHVSNHDAKRRAIHFHDDGKQKQHAHKQPRIADLTESNQRDRADGDWSDAFDRVQDFDFAGVGLIGMLFLIREIQDLPPSFDEHDGVGSVSDGFDPLREILFVVANGPNIRARS